MTNPHSMRGGVIGALLTLIAIVAVAVVVFIAVDVLLLDSSNMDRLSGQSSSLFSQEQDAQAISAADAVRIGREEAERVAARVAQQAARQSARATIEERTEGQATDQGTPPPAAPALNTLSGSQQVAAREAKRVAERIAEQIARDVATDELMAYVDTVTGFSGTSNASDGDDDVEATETNDAQDVADEEYDEDPAQPEDTAAVETPTPASPVTEPQPAVSSTSLQEQQTVRARPSASNAATPTPRAAPKPSALDLKPWWPSTVPAGQLGLRFAGEAQSNDHGIALLFSAQPKSLDAVNEHIRVLDDAGQTVDVQWSSGRNAALVQTNALPAGRYVVIISTGLRSQAGEAIARKLEGPVFVNAN